MIPSAVLSLGLYYHTAAALKCVIHFKSIDCTMSIGQCARPSMVPFEGGQHH